MKGRVILRYVGNRPEPELAPIDEELREWFEPHLIAPPLPDEIFQWLRFMLERAERITAR